MLGSRNISRNKVYGYINFVNLGGTKKARQIFRTCASLRFSSGKLWIPKKYSRFLGYVNLYWHQQCIRGLLTSEFIASFMPVINEGRRLIYPISPHLWESLKVMDVKIDKTKSLVLWKLLLYKRAMTVLATLLKEVMSIIAETRTKKVKDSPITVWSSLQNKNAYSSRALEFFNFRRWLAIILKVLPNELNFEDASLFFNFSTKKNGKINPISSKSFRLNETQKYIREILRIVFLGMIRCSLFKPEFLSIGDQLALAIKVELSDATTLPQYVFFSESDGIVRPIWTYLAEESGAHVIFLFFSNFDSPLTLEGEDASYDAFKCSTWSEFWVIDGFQRSRLQNALLTQNVQFRIVGTPWRADSHFMPKIPEGRLIAIFDNESHVDFYYWSSIVDYGFYGSKKDLDFLNDLVEVAERNNLILIHKPKREIGHKRSKDYEDLLASLENSSNYIRVHPDTSPERIIQRVDAVVSIPFTSTALIAKQLGKNSAFYDPTGLLSDKEPCLRDIPLFHNVSSIESWLLRNIL